MVATGGSTAIMIKSLLRLTFVPFLCFGFDSKESSEKHQSISSLTRGEGGGWNAKMISNIFGTLSNFNNMSGIRNPRTARDARATNDLRVTAVGHFFLVVIVM